MIKECINNSILVTAIILLVVIIVQLIISLIVKIIIYLCKSVIKLITPIEDKTATHIVWWIANRLTFVGTIHHELSHALLAFVSGAKVLKVDLFKPHGNTLGQVYFRPQGGKFKRAMQQSIVAVAPTILGTINSILIVYYLVCYSENINMIVKVLLWYTAISIILHSTMSKQDMRVVYNGLVLSSLIIMIITFIINLAIHVGL